MVALAAMQLVTHPAMPRGSHCPNQWLDTRRGEEIASLVSTGGNYFPPLTVPVLDPLAEPE